MKSHVLAFLGFLIAFTIGLSTTQAAHYYYDNYSEEFVVADTSYTVDAYGNRYYPDSNQRYYQNTYTRTYPASYYPTGYTTYSSSNQYYQNTNSNVYYSNTNYLNGNSYYRGCGRRY